MVLNFNAKILTWARERNGFSIEDLAEKLKKDPKEIEMWEAGNVGLPYGYLEDLAYRHLKIPVAIFFFPEPPNLEDPKKKFRRLPDYEFTRLSSDTLQTIRVAQAYQDSLTELFSKNLARRQIFRDLSPKSNTARELAQKARDYLGVTVKQQFKFESCEQAFKAWRHALEETGVFTFKDSLKDRFISGFCLLHEEFPIIMVNNSNAFSRQVFTVAHELGHILFGIHGVTDVDEAYIDWMDSDEKLLEVKCNEFAAEFLVPSGEFRKEISLFQSSGVAAIPEIAQKYSVSRIVILRRLLDYKLVSPQEYDTLSGEWNKDYLRSRKERPCGNYYLTRLAYLGEGFTQLAFQNYHEGRLTKTQVAAHLNMNARNIDKLEKYVGW